VASEQEQREQEERDRQAHIERANHIELGLAFMLDQELSLSFLEATEEYAFEGGGTPFSESYGHFPSPADALVALAKRNGDFHGLQ